MATKKNQGKKTSAKTGKRLINLKVTAKEYGLIRANAKRLKAGNVSAWLREAGCALVAAQVLKKPLTKKTS